MNVAPTLVNAFRFAAVLARTAPRRSAEAALVTLGLSCTEGVGLLLLVPLLQLVGVDAQRGPLNGIVRAAASGLSTLGIPLTLAVVLGIYTLCIAAQSALQWRHAILNTQLQQDIVYALRVRLYRAIAGARWLYFARERSSEFVHALTDQIDRVGGAAYCLVDLVVTGATALVYVAIALRVSPGLTAIVLVCGGALGLTARVKLARSRRIGQLYSDTRTRLHAAISEQLASVKIAKSYCAEERHALEFTRLSREFSDVELAATRSYAALRQQMALGSAVGLAAIVYVSRAALTVSTGQLLLLLFVFARLMPRVTGLYEKAQMLVTLLPAYDAIDAVERRCLAEAEPAVESAASIEFTRLVQFDRVTFDYSEDGATPAIRDLDLTIVAGSTTAIVGASGAGKSTVADLLMGLLEPRTGRILIDGRPLAAPTRHAWREQIGYVSQDPFLFHDTVRANLLWAAPGSTEDTIWRALELAAAAEFVRALPQGLDTIVGDRGLLLSGGERQRLSLARALIRQPRLLILDEATSSLDSENEQRIQDAIERLHHTTTIAVITHRLSTVRGADVIHVLDRGRLVESGAWEELVHRPAGRFRDLCRAQGLDASGSSGESASTAAPRLAYATPVVHP